MTEKQIDYGPRGVGKFVSLIFPKGYQEKNPGVPASSLIDAIGVDEIGHLWGDNKILEFFWKKELDATKVNKVLNHLLAKHPSLKIQFTEGPVITM